MFIIDFYTFLGVELHINFFSFNLKIVKPINFLKLLYVGTVHIPLVNTNIRVYLNQFHSGPIYLRKKLYQKIFMLNLYNSFHFLCV